MIYVKHNAKLDMAGRPTFVFIIILLTMWLRLSVSWAETPSESDYAQDVLNDVNFDDVTAVNYDDVTAQYSNSTDNERPRYNVCRIFAADPFISKRIRLKVDEEHVKFIEYKLTFDNYTTNPLNSDVMTTTYKADTWTRVTSLHGRTLISLAFNYGILSLMTLTLSTDFVEVRHSLSG